MQQTSDNLRNTPAEQTLDLAMVISTIVVLLGTFYLVASGMTSFVELAVIVAGDLFFVFLLTPHLVSRWLGYEVEELLDPEQTPSPIAGADSNE